MLPGLITLTGADERTDIDALVELVHANPLVEIGLLLTLSPEGCPRYPSLAWIDKAAAKLSGRCALHVCGAAARALLIDGGLATVTRHAPRVQVNGLLGAGEVETIAALVDTVITQHNDANLALLSVRARNHQLLMDASGGRGLSPATWSPPDTEKLVGFAGGMGPDNLAAELARLAPVARDGAWVDMENKLRTDDWFDLAIARRCVEIFTSVTTSPTPAGRAAPRV